MKIKLLKPHTDAGKAYPDGAVLMLDDATAQRLIKKGVAEKAAAHAQVVNVPANATAEEKQ